MWLAQMQMSAMLMFKTGGDNSQPPDLSQGFWQTQKAELIIMMDSVQLPHTEVPRALGTLGHPRHSANLFTGLSPRDEKFDFT